MRCYQLALMKRNIFESASSSLDIPGRPLNCSWRPCRPRRPRHLDGRVLGPRLLPLQHRVRLSQCLPRTRGWRTGTGKLTRDALAASGNERSSPRRRTSSCACASARRRSPVPTGHTRSTTSSDGACTKEAGSRGGTGALPSLRTRARPMVSSALRRAGTRLLRACHGFLRTGRVPGKLTWRLAGWQWFRGELARLELWGARQACLNHEGNMSETPAANDQVRDPFHRGR